jgi:hypothetical protein
MSYPLTTLISNVLPLLHATVPAELVYWSEQEIYNWTDEELKLLAKEGPFVVRDTVAIVAGTAIYSAPTGHLSTIHVAHNNAPLRPSSTQELELKDPAYATFAGTPLYWYVGTYNQIALYPVPNAAAIALASTVEVIYHQYPPAPDDLITITLPVPAVIGEMIEMMVVAQAYAKESDSQVPEIAAHLVEVGKLAMAAVQGLWGSR